MILEIILDEPAGDIQVHGEHSILFNAECRCVRLDIYASNHMQVEYNLEMQNENQGNLAKRSRYHQAQMDVSALKPGEDFNQLRPGYVVFICTFDPFQKGLYRYTFEEHCLKTGLSLGDGTRKIFLNTKGKNDSQVPRVLANFLHYVETSTDDLALSSNSQSIRRIHQKITGLKHDRRLEVQYMTVDELIQQEARKSVKEGISLGQKQMLELFAHMTKAGEENLIPRLASEPALLEEMLNKYHLQSDSI